MPRNMIGVAYNLAHTSLRSLDRVPAGRLFDIATVLKAPMTCFFAANGEASSPALEAGMTTKPKSVFWALPQQLVSDTRGVTLPLVAAAITALIGFTGLGVETGLWYAMKRQNQSAADVAALSGALELYTWQAQGSTATATYPDICGFAKRDATRNGFTFLSFTCPTSTPACTSPSSGQMCANNPPATAGTLNFGNNNAVEVILAQQQNALFASLSLANVTIGTRAVAVISILDQSCLLALDSNPADHKTILIQ